MTELDALSVSLSTLVDVDEAMQHAIGAAGKEAASDAAARDLGADRRFSGVKSRSADLRSGYDLGDPVVLNLRPDGLWILAEHGRRKSGRIVPKRARIRQRGRKPRGRAAVGSGGRFVAVGRYRPARGHRTITDLVDDLETSIPAAIGAALDDKVRRL